MVSNWSQIYWYRIYGFKADLPHHRYITEYIVLKLFSSDNFIMTTSISEIVSFSTLRSMVTSPVLKSSKLEFDNYQSIFVWHFAYQSIPTTNVLAKYRSFLWNWTPSHIQRIYKGQNSENPLRAITFDWSVLRTWDQRLWAAVNTMGMTKIYKMLKDWNHEYTFRYLHKSKS